MFGELTILRFSHMTVLHLLPAVTICRVPFHPTDLIGGLAHVMLWMLEGCKWYFAILLLYILMTQAWVTCCSVSLTKSWLFGFAGALMAGLRDVGGTTQCFNSDNPINSRNWAKALAATSVIVMTAQSFLNVLRDNTASLHDIALMVGQTLNTEMISIICIVYLGIVHRPSRMLLHLCFNICPLLMHALYLIARQLCQCSNTNQLCILHHLQMQHT